ncbi:MAG: hypothetical protein I8H71_14680, partial [Xanthomonadaceae bacterium]|nr:hypothetical protein [Xanthomonadaceae bacterium]
MNRIPRLHVLTAALLGLALTAGAALPAAAQDDGNDRRAERLERRLQKSEKAAETPRPAPAESRSQRSDPPQRFE